MDTSQSDEQLQQDPDYFSPVNENINHDDIFRENALSTANKISSIIETEFMKEIDAKKSEVFEIYKTLNKACKMLHFLRYAVVTDFYNQEHLYNDKLPGFNQTRPHPTVNAAVKKVFNDEPTAMNECLQEMIKQKRKIDHDNTEPLKKIPKSEVIESSHLFSNNKMKKRIIVGNISKWIPPNQRENSATHKWTIYVRDSQKSDLGQFISKVRFFLHPSYKPNDVIELTSTPFHLSRLGWGEFPARVQLHFVNSYDKPVDIIHHIKLDRTFTGLQTIGSETVVDLWISLRGEQILASLEEFNKQSDKGISLLNEKGEDDEATSSHEKDEERQICLPHEQEDQKILPELWHLYNDHNYLGTNFKYNEQFHNELVKMIAITSVEQNEVKNSIIIKQKSFLKKPEEKGGISLLKPQFRNLKKDENNFSSKLDNSQSKVQDYKNLCTSYIVDNKKLDPERTFKKIINLIERTKPKTLSSLLKLIVRRIPLITEKATNLNYKILHPYATESYQIFHNYSEPKQRSLERYQALYVLDIMRSAKCQEICSIKEFMTWARRFSYTPVFNTKNMHKLCVSSDQINIEENTKKYESTSTISDQVNKWLSNCQKVKPKISRSSHKSDDDEEIDILNVPPKTTNSLSNYQNPKLTTAPLVILEYPKTQNSLNEFVFKTSQKIGIKLVNEEIVPGVSHNSANLVITKAVECLIDDLVRLAFSTSLDRCHTQKDTVIVESEDVRMALLKKEEFDIFTNAGLGSEG